MIKKIILGIILIGFLYFGYKVYVWNNPTGGPNTCSPDDQACLDDWYHNNK